MERKLQISAFRNIGFEDNKPSNEGIVLNHSLKKGDMGDLVILIGANNSGKSNILDALEAYKNKSIKDRDITDLFMDEECRKPSIRMVCNDEEKQYGARIFKEGPPYIVFPGIDDKKFEIDLTKFSPSPQDLSFELINVCRLEENTVAAEKKSFTKYFGDPTLIAEMPENKIHSILKAYFSFYEKMIEDKENWYTNFLSNINENYPILNEFKRAYRDYKNEIKNNNTIEKLNEVYNENYGYTFEPNIYKYEQVNIKNNNLETNYSELMGSKFILEVLRSIDVEPNTIINAHNDATRLRNFGLLKTTERMLNKKLANVAKRFNKLYYLEDIKYSFEFILESERIFFTLYRGEQAISLDYQSTGFKWFFDLYFNLFASSYLKPGDIVIMDEPATNLHVKGQIELRQFLKEFARKNDISIVIATHSPFLIDLDYLDELRIVTNKNNISTIENDFSTINVDDPDSLLPIKESLTVENHVLFDQDQIVVFVEGITDYNYLVGMKKVLGYDNITFLPIKGVGDKGQQLEISKKLIKIRKHNPLLLADSDGAGKAMKKVNADSELKVILLSDVNEKFSEIESLFSQEDAIKYGIVDENGKVIKRSTNSAIFKNDIISNPSYLSEETKENFKMIFDSIIE